MGHGLAGITAALLRPRGAASRARAGWLALLVLCAWAPDLDYLVPFPGTASDPNARITHSLLGSLVAPTVVALGARLSGLRGARLRRHTLEAALAGLSHPLLDLLVGVTPLPLGWPLWDGLLRLPFGVLPSAGRIRPGNVYFWRNLGLELGALGPLVAVVTAWSRGGLASRRARVLAGAGLGISAGCMALAAGLQR
ncbi:MAG: metal-dependent hydrolase [Deltaproteobacteria bacterium]|nr:metal-dependent hydrolase [Deltaproteobacteria bacterium]